MSQQSFILPQEHHASPQSRPLGVAVLVAYWANDRLTLIFFKKDDHSSLTEIFWLLHWFEASIQGINEGSNWWQLEAENMVRGGMQTYAEDSHGGLSLLYTSSFLNITELRGTHMLWGRMSALAFQEPVVFTQSPKWFCWMDSSATSISPRGPLAEGVSRSHFHGPGAVS